MLWLSFVLVLCVYANIELEDGISVLTESNFEEFTSSNDFSLIEFYAPWCGHCKALTPVYVLAQKQLNDMGLKTPLAKIDCTKHAQTCQKYQVQGYPTLKLFQKGEFYLNYESERSQAAIVQFIAKRTGPPTTHITTEEDLDKFIQGQPGGKVLSNFEAGSELFGMWEETARKGSLTSFSFAHVDKSLWQGEGSIRLVAADGQNVVYTGANEAEAIAAWILEAGFPLLDELSQESWTRGQTHGKLLAVFSDSKDELEAANAIATSYKGQFVATKSANTQILSRWGATGQLPSAVILEFGKDGSTKLWTWNEETEVDGLTEATLKRFVDGVFDKTYVNNLKSEPIPNQPEDASPKVLVGKTLKAEINNPDKLVFVEFYAPWCGHCKKLTPIWDELGAHYKLNNKVVIAKIDATANSVEDSRFQISGYPTLMAFHGDNVQQYQAAHDLDSMKAFLDDILEDMKEKSDL